MISRGSRTLLSVSEQRSSAERLSELFDEHAPRVYAYARRHVAIDQCDDVVSETFLVAWRRPERIPPDPLPWLLVVARHVIANQRRTADRADRVWFAAVDALWTQPPPAQAQEAVIGKEDVLAALNACSRVEREALLLVAWEGLTPAQAARVAGCSVRAFTVRLYRARRRLNQAFQPDAEPVSGPLPRPYLLKEPS